MHQLNAHIHEKFSNQNNSGLPYKIPDPLIDVLLHSELPPTPGDGTSLSSLSLEKVIPHVDQHIDGIKTLYSRISYLSEDQFTHIVDKINRLCRKTNFKKDPFEHISQKINIILEAFLDTRTFQRISNKGTETFDRYLEPNMGDPTPDMHIPTADAIIINLMWIRKEKDNDPNGLVFPQTYTRNQKETSQQKVIDIFERLNDWAENFPKVIFWYDGTLLSDGAIERTQAAIAKNCAHHQKIELRDVRSLAVAQEIKYRSQWNIKIKENVL